MYVINKDRDRMVEYSPTKVRIETNVVNDRLIGFNVYHEAPEVLEGPFVAFDDEIGEVLLGDFETYEECEDLIEIMNGYDKPFFVVGDYEDYDYEG